MAVKFIIDAHALIWFLEGNPKLSTNARAVMEDPSSLLFLPSIALAEALWAVEHGRTVISSAADVIRSLRADSRFSIVPLDLSIVELSISLVAVGEIHDRQIVATTLALISPGDTVSLVSRDPNILAANLVNMIW